jgi:hypothetical protein
MSETTLPLAAPLMPERRIFEQALYAASPFGTLATTLLVFGLLVASFALALVIDGYPALTRTAHGWIPNGGVWPALVLSVLVTVALGMQRYVRNRDFADYAALLAVMPGCVERDARMYDDAGLRRLRIGTAIGALIGALPTLIAAPHDAIAREPAMFGWFLLVNAFTAALFARGIVQSARAAENWARSIDQSLIIDLLRIDTLNVIGRHGARTALIWFSVAAAILLFFVGNNMNALTLAVLLLAAAMGVWIFVRPMDRVHRRIRAAKGAELEAVRREIGAARLQVPYDATAAAALQGLLAYEARIEQVREWPFDQPTAIRMAAYVLIPAIPWFGQAVAGYFVAHFVHAAV